MDFRALSATGFGFAVRIDSCATAYRLCRLMLQSHSRTLFLLYLKFVEGFFVTHAGVVFEEMLEVIGESTSSKREFLFFLWISAERRMKETYT